MTQQGRIKRAKSQGLLDGQLRRFGITGMDARLDRGEWLVRIANLSGQTWSGTGPTFTTALNAALASIETAARA